MKTEHQLETKQRISSCPVCNSNAKTVGAATLKALLNDDLISQFNAESEDNKTRWRFCDSVDCDVVYFSESGETTFSKSQLKVPVGIKETSGERPLCYCFGHSAESIKDEIRANGKSVALEDIRAKMKDPGCRCETKNPSGSCCLGNVAKGIEISQKELGMNETVLPSSSTPAKSSGRKGEKIAKVGTIVSAIMASSCCWLPLVLLAVGVSGAGIASTLEAYRPLFMVVTFGFLSSAFYFTYRPRKTANSEEHGCCVTKPMSGEDCCAPAKGRFNMLAMNKVMLWGVTAMAVSFLFFPSYVGILFGGNGEIVTEEMNQAVIKIDGMTCEGCSAAVSQAIQSTPGVLAVEVNFKKGEAIVGTMSCCSIPEQEILAAIRQSGFEGSFIQEKPDPLHKQTGD